MAVEREGFDFVRAGFTTRSKPSGATATSKYGLGMMKPRIFRDSSFPPMRPKSFPLVS